MNSHRRAIDLITQDLDWKKICIEFAKLHPKSFVAVASRLGPVVTNSIEDQVKNYATANGGYPFRHIGAGRLGMSKSTCSFTTEEVELFRSAFNKLQKIEEKENA